MKNLLIVLFTFLSVSLYAQVKVAPDGSIRSTGNYPSVNMREDRGYAFSVKSIVDRNSIPSNYRDTGMLILVRDSSILYTLVGGITNGNWIEAGTSKLQDLYSVSHVGNTTNIPLIINGDGYNNVQIIDSITGKSVIIGISSDNKPQIWMKNATNTAKIDADGITNDVFLKLPDTTGGIIAIAGKLNGITYPGNTQGVIDFGTIDFGSDTTSLLDSSQITVFVDSTTSDPAIAHAIGQRVLVGYSPIPTGVFATKAGWIADWDNTGGVWTFTDPTSFLVGTYLSDANEDDPHTMQWDGTIWVRKLTLHPQNGLRIRQPAVFGTKDNFPDIFKVNGHEVGRWTTDSSLQFTKGAGLTDNNYAYRDSVSGKLKFKAFNRLVVDSTLSSGGAFIRNDTIFVPKITGGSGGIESVTGNITGLVNNTDPLNPIVNAWRFGIEDNLGLQDRAMNMQLHSLSVDSLTSFNFHATNTASYSGTYFQNDNQFAQLYNVDNSGNANDAGFYSHGDSITSFTGIWATGGNATQLTSELDVHPDRFDFNVTNSASDSIPAKIYVPYSDSLNVSSPTRIAVWDNDTLKSANATAMLFGIGDNLGLQDRSVDMQYFNFSVFNSKQWYLSSDAGVKTADIVGSTNGSLPHIQLNVQDSAGNGDANVIDIYPDSTIQRFFDDGFVKDFAIKTPTPTNGEYYSPLSVNGNYADSTGNITISGGSSSKFGFSGEDATAGENRNFDFGSHSFTIGNTTTFDQLVHSGNTWDIFATNVGLTNSSDITVDGSSIQIAAYDIQGSPTNGDIWWNLVNGYAELNAYKGFLMTNAISQGTISTASPNASAILELRGGLGFLPPRMSTTGRNGIVSPAEGLVVYDTDLHKLYVFDGTIWQAAW